MKSTNKPAHTPETLSLTLNDGMDGRKDVLLRPWSDKGFLLLSKELIDCVHTAEDMLRTFETTHGIKCHASFTILNDGHGCWMLDTWTWNPHIRYCANVYPYKKALRSVFINAAKMSR